ncbi:hypothetical protein FRC17_009836 [Serendipita sp. 399]|nr:hypothetical protein FRC17_009836 [Serendipita sp. 399]
MSEVLKKKIVLVGDKGVGKTRLMIMFHSGEFHTEFLPSYADHYIEDIEIKGKRIELSVWDTPGDEAYFRLRPLTYPNTDVFLFCLSVDDPESLKSIRETWIPEILNFAPNVPRVLVGCKQDLRGDRRTIDTLQKAGLEFVTQEQGEAMAREIGAVIYLECSARRGDGVMEVFQTAARTALDTSKTRKRGRCIPF